MKFEKLPPAQLSRELRQGSNANLGRRRWGVGLSLAGVMIGGIVGAYQIGLIKRLPDIAPGDLFDAEKVDASDYAYAKLQTPDAFLMIVTYGVTAALLAAGGKDRARQNPALPVAAAAKAGYDLLTCLRLARLEWQENRAFCSWCQAATLISATIFALSLAEAREAAGELAAS
jgi:uncharacterized membrane protein